MFKMFRRSLCAALLVTASWGTAAVAQSAPEPFRLGIMGDHGGPNVDTSGPRTVYAVQMAVDDFGGKVLGPMIARSVADVSITSVVSMADIEALLKDM